MCETIISAPRVDRLSDGDVRIVSIITSPTGERKELWYKVSREYESKLVWERADAFLVGLIPFISRNGGKVVSEAPISAHLLHNIRNLLSPVLPAFEPTLAPLDIKAEADSTVLNTKSAAHVGTGCSCGIDSMSTLAVYAHDDTPPSMRITALTFFDVGSHGNYASGKSAEIANGRMRNIKTFADHVHMPLIGLCSNISEFNAGFAHINLHTFRNMSAVLALQKQFSGYHYASGFPITHFKITFDGLSHSDEFLLRCLSTESTTLFSSLAALNRQERTSIIANYKPAHKFLNVCVREIENCGFCFKCARTMFQLDVIDKLDLFSEVFDVDSYRKNRRKILKLLSKDTHFHDEFMSAAANSNKCPYSQIQLKLAFAAGNISQTLVKLRKQVTEKFKS